MADHKWLSVGWPRSLSPSMFKSTSARCRDEHGDDRKAVEKGTGTTTEAALAL